ncbi:MAG: oligosaccharide flippase family protein [Candidatus Ozemobacteraceae bacterium]
MKTHNKTQYRSVLKSSSLIGGSAFINIFIQMIKTKVIAVLLGPTGVGLMNMYTVLSTTGSTIAGLGLQSSGVRSISGAIGENDSLRVAKISKTIAITLWFTGIAVCILTIALSPIISQQTFGNSQHVNPIRILSLSILFANLLVGKTCLLQGHRRIADIAKQSILGAISGTVISIPCIYLLGESGIAISLLLTSISLFTGGVWFSRKIIMAETRISIPEFKSELKSLLSFGLPVMGVAFQGALMAYFLRLIILNKFDMAGVGIWSAAFAISGVLTNFVLNAMGTDYYPRLAAISNNYAKVSNEVNTQLEIALLLAVPALVITVLFAPYAIELLYSGKFDQAVPILRWSVYGILGRVISWPLSFIMPAQGRGVIFFFTDLFANISHLTLLYFCGIFFGLQGTGIAFMINYIIYIVLMIFVAKKIAKTYISRRNAKMIFLSIITLLVSSFAHYYIANAVLFYITGFIFAILVSYICAKRLSILTGVKMSDVKMKLFNKR